MLLLLKKNLLSCLCTIRFYEIKYWWYCACFARINCLLGLVALGALRCLGIGCHKLMGSIGLMLILPNDSPAEACWQTGKLMIRLWNESHGFMFSIALLIVPPNLSGARVQVKVRVFESYF